MSAFNTPWFNNQDPSFFNSLNKSKIAHVVLTAETEDFDEETTKQWIDEGFDVRYVPLLNGGDDFIKRVHTVGDSFGPSEQYAIVGTVQVFIAISTFPSSDSGLAYGEAAHLALEGHVKPNNPKLIAVVAYYPTTIPSIHTKFPASIQVVVHLAGNEIGVHKHPEVLGIQGKRKTVRKRIDPGVGYGETLKLSFKAYTYTGVQPGFAEHDLEEFDPVANGVAFTRSLQCVKRGFRLENDIESVKDNHIAFLHSGKHEKAMNQTRPYAHVMHTPTLVGGVGSEDLQDFYENFFTPIPPQTNAQVRLISRTVGTDRVVDELYVSLTHTIEVPWLLPGIPPTNKRIEIAIVSIFHVRGSKMESEHIYWDQASVLAQAGLLDPRLVPDAMKKKGVKQLPVLGAESARAMKRGSSRQINQLIPDW